jgi:hypothetical protein
MRVLLLAMATIAAISAASPARAQAYNSRYPVCMRVIENFGGERNECIYYSLQQCQQRAAGLPATCIVNPFYRGPRQ